MKWIKRILNHNIKVVWGEKSILKRVLEIDLLLQSFLYPNIIELFYQIDN